LHDFLSCFVGLEQYCRSPCWLAVMSSPSTASPQSRSALGLPPEPWLVAWYFANRVLANYETGYTAAQSAANDRLWNFICENDRPPPADWLAGNNAAVCKIMHISKPEQPADAVEKLNDRLVLPERSARAGYMRDYMRQRRKRGR
jgi:hypothetical protein